MAGPISRAAREPQRQAQRAPQEEDLSFLGEEQEGPFTVDPSRIPDGMTYMWRRVSYAGKEDVKHQASGQRKRWMPVPNQRHPEIIGERAAKETPEAAIIVDGLMLCERPAFITKAAEARRDEVARSRVRNQMQSLKLTPEGQLPRKQVTAKRAHNIQVAEPDEPAGGDDE